MEENKEKSKESDKSSKHELALEELQKEFTSYKKEKREQISLVQEQLDAARSECSAMLAEKTKLASKLEFSDEKHRLLETNTTNVTAEVCRHLHSYVFGDVWLSFIASPLGNRLKT